MDFITQNLGTIIVLAVLLAVLALIVKKMVKNKREGKTSCGCGCEGCALKDKCHTKNQ